MTLVDTINMGLNNPDCAFFVGNYMGQLFTIHSMLILLSIYLGFKFLDKLAVEPLIKYIKTKIKRKGD